MSHGDACFDESPPEESGFETLRYEQPAQYFDSISGYVFESEQDRKPKTFAPADVARWVPEYTLRKWLNLGAPITDSQDTVGCLSRFSPHSETFTGSPYNVSLVGMGSPLIALVEDPHFSFEDALATIVNPKKSIRLEELIAMAYYLGVSAEQLAKPKTLGLIHKRTTYTFGSQIKKTRSSSRSDAYQILMPRIRNRMVSN